MLNDPVTARYTHTLTVTTAGEYTCTVANDKPSSATSSSTSVYSMCVEMYSNSASIHPPSSLVAAPPTDVAGVQDGPTSIRVTWTPPDPLDGVTGYRIHHTTGGGSSGNMSVDGGSTDNYTLTGLTNGETYTISIVGTLATGVASVPEMITVGLGMSIIFGISLMWIAVPGEPEISGTVTANTTSLSWSVPNGSVVDEYLIQWERDTTGACSDEDTDSTTISDGSATSHTIPGLEEDSTYTITVTASNTAGSSNVSNTVTAMTGEAGKGLYHCNRLKFCINCSQFRLPHLPMWL